MLHTANLEAGGVHLPREMRMNAGGYGEFAHVLVVCRYLPGVPVIYILSVPASIAMR
ncbi:hypothetical protein NG798_24435 [Ancylothrix sp. C2]|uniref:hypothetical protein n=1 Tax=Ancylothrix sp. D3o TaxID=2953691 RepID=UPI0021BA69BD|nr:hypothetical protein [Ancylothrix sp. D3o]MCT7952950.1 hypothetical protein [Ancylothrix sp. D3o]